MTEQKCPLCGKELLLQDEGEFLPTDKTILKRRRRASIIREGIGDI